MSEIVMSNLGQLVMTKTALHTIDHESVLTALRQYIHGDWGMTCKEDWKLNDQAVKSGDRVLAVYKDINGEKFWIITEANRESTTILLPGDY